MPGSFYSISVGKEEKFRAALHDAGITADMVDAIIGSKVLARSMIASVREHLERPTIFSDRRQMLASLIRRAKLRDWPLSEYNLDRLVDCQPEVPTDPFVGLSFKIWLGDLETTMQELVLWLKDELPVLQSAMTEFGPSDIRLLDPIQDGTAPFVNWAAVDFGANKAYGTVLEDAIDRKKSAGLELLAALPLHQEYQRRYDSELAPAFYIGGLEVSNCGWWGFVPYLERATAAPQELMMLWAYHNSLGTYGAAVPELRKLQFSR